MARLLLLIAMVLIYANNVRGFNPTCDPISFEGDQAVVSGYLPSTDWVCYKFEFKEPTNISITINTKHADLTLIQADSAIFFGVKELELQGALGAYELRVGPPYRLPSEDFTFVFKRNFEMERKNWQPMPPQRGSVHSVAMSEDGLTEIHTSCSAMERGIGFNLIHKGKNLKTVDDASEELMFTVESNGATIHYENISMHYYEPELTHVLSGVIKAPGLDAFGRGSKLKITNSDRQLVAAFDLSGSGKLRQAIKSRCRY